MQKTSKLSDMLALADTVLLQAVKGITDLINVPGLINADFADLRTVMKEVGPAIMGSGVAVGESRATEAAKRAIDNQLLEEVGLDGARGLLINISASEESFTMAEFMEASALIQDKVDEDAKVVIGALYDNNLGEELHVTVIATGVGDINSRQETIAQVGDLPLKQQKNNVDRESQPVMKPAPTNHQKKVTALPKSNFDAFDNLSPGRRADKDERLRDEGWYEDYLETPTYLRKKAN
jgi:cell division protein FtsZ